jgi:hypothetical protein
MAPEEMRRHGGEVCIKAIGAKLADEDIESVAGALTLLQDGRGSSRVRRP